MASVEDALHALASITSDAEIAEAARARWGARADASKLPAALRGAADDLATALPALTQSDPAAAVALLDGPDAEVVLAWCAASAWRRDTSMAPLLAAASARPAMHERVVAVARDRIVEGPLL